jgi:hypothetical protein
MYWWAYEQAFAILLSESPFAKPDELIARCDAYAHAYAAHQPQKATTEG